MSYASPFIFLTEKNIVELSTSSEVDVNRLKKIALAQLELKAEDNKVLNKTMVLSSITDLENPVLLQCHLFIWNTPPLKAILIFQEWYKIEELLDIEIPQHKEVVQFISHQLAKSLDSLKSIFQKENPEILLEKINLLYLKGWIISNDFLIIQTHFEFQLQEWRIDFINLWRTYKDSNKSHKDIYHQVNNIFRDNVIYCLLDMPYYYPYQKEVIQILHDVAVDFFNSGYAKWAIKLIRIGRKIVSTLEDKEEIERLELEFKIRKGKSNPKEKIITSVVIIVVAIALIISLFV